MKSSSIDTNEQFRLSGKEHHNGNGIENIGKVKFGDGSFCFIAGPCSVENEEQICRIAAEIKKAGASMLRGGAFKPRTSPYSFQGIGIDGIRMLEKAKKLTGLPIVTEITDIKLLPEYENVDVIQVGARNMQNFELLKELGRTKKHILLKRGFGSTVDELLMSAEYIMSGGNGNIILCERGIRTFETSTRNTFDVSAIAVLKQKTHLPVIADPSHASGMSSLIKPLTLAACAAGADGAMIEVHYDPQNALSDGNQAVTPEEFSKIVSTSLEIRKATMKG